MIVENHLILWNLVSLGVWCMNKQSQLALDEWDYLSLYAMTVYNKGLDYISFFC
jgi:hypothetical protein